MESFWRKKYRKEAAAWAAEGRRAMSIQPQHLLALLDDYRPPPPPTELERRVAQLQRELKDTQGRLRTESERANRAYAEGHAAAVLEREDEMRRLRSQLNLRTATAQSSA